MPNISPNMMLPVPIVGVDPGPQWASYLDACMALIDSHNHSPGQGVVVNPNGFLINSDLLFNSHNATLLRSDRYVAQSAPLALSTDVGCTYVSGVDLWYNDISGNQIRLTAAGSPSAGAGTITGLPSGSASASYAGGMFIFQSATSTPAEVSIGPLIIGRQVPATKTVTITPSSTQAANYSLTLPIAPPSTARQALVSDTSGNLSFTSQGQVPIGSVIATFPNLSGAYTTTATTVADVNGWVLCQGQTISDGTSPMNGQVVPNINNNVFLLGYTTAGLSGGSFSNTLTLANLPSHTHGAGSYATSISGTFAAVNHTHNYGHWHQWAYSTDFANELDSVVSPSITTGTFTATGNHVLTQQSAPGTGINFDVYPPADARDQPWFTSGALYAGGNTTVTSTESADASLSGSNSVTGTSGSTGSGSSFNIVPPYISAVFLMRIR